ncbi:nitroreductase family protein, partial [Nocardia salmonicida]|uniref:nitroreductase family protein n=1 Tax=Nocardia salmonicida TaxID=53431 RepID=UPI003470435F
GRTHPPILAGDQARARTGLDTFRQTFGIPDDYTPVGAITVGHRLADSGSPGSPRRRPRKPLEEVVHRGRWGG